jgi:glycosyltransferase involved in cell wall biosynthesis
MKIIALFPIKNDAWILPSTMPQLKLFADEILCMDGGSTDETKAVLKSYGALVRDQDQTNLNYSSWRQELLDWGRERGGTHFIWLDSDEAFTTNFLTIFKEEMLKLQPGQKLVMKWLCLWKNPRRQRSDDSIWSNLYKDFIFCDDGVSNFGTTKLHESRTPGENNKITMVRLPEEKGAVLHFQFVTPMRFQIKQVFQRCREYTLGTGTARRLNYKYSVTFDDLTAKTTPLPPAWTTDMKGLDIITDTDTAWYNDEILTYFEQRGIEFFEPLQIWHIKKYKDLFVAKTGREPETKTYPSFVIFINTLKNKILHRQ